MVALYVYQSLFAQKAIIDEDQLYFTIYSMCRSGLASQTVTYCTLNILCERQMLAVMNLI